MKQFGKVSRVAFGALATTAFVGSGGSLAWADGGGHGGGGAGSAAANGAANGNGAGDSGSRGQDPAGSAGPGAAASPAASSAGSSSPGSAGAAGGSASPSSASQGGNAPAGNNGTVKIDQYSADPGQDNDPHVSCGFSVSFYGYDGGPQTASLTITPVAPTAGGSSYSTSTSWNVGTRTSGSQFDANVPVSGADLASALSGVTPQAQQGYHLRLEVEVTGSQGSDDKYKVFWMEPCAAPTSPATSPSATTPSAGTPSAAPATPTAPATAPASGSPSSASSPISPVVPVALAAGRSTAPAPGAADSSTTSSSTFFGSTAERTQLAAMTGYSSSAAVPVVGGILPITAAATSFPAVRAGASLPSVLAFTGSDTGGLIGGGAILIGLGTATVVATSRRRRLGRAQL